MRHAVLSAIALLAGTGPAWAEQGSLPTWLAGCWEQVSGESWVEECWMAPRGDIMLGSGRAGRGDSLGEWEATQIGRAEDGMLTFWASPQGAGRTAFTLQVQSSDSVTFVNAAHDYPQRVRYWRDGDLMKAEVAMADGSKAIGFAYRRVR